MWNIKNFINSIRLAPRYFKVYESLKTNKPGLILRHDVDWSIDDAFKFFEIERQNNIKSTYYFRVSSPTYNILSNESKKILREIEGSGFEVGLHFDKSIYTKNILSNFLREKSILQEILGKKIFSYSDHIPSLNGFFKKKTKLFNAYDKKIFTKNNYISDSRYEYKKNFINFIKKSNSKKMYCLTHPEYYFENKRSYSLIIKRYLKNKKNRLVNEIKINNKNFKKFI